MNFEGDTLVTIRKWATFHGTCLWFVLLLILLVGWRALAVHAEEKETKRIHERIKGEVKMDETFEQAFGPGFCFRLDPDPLGWTIVIKDERGTEDISRLTPPFHFVPNPRDIEGWHFRNADNSGRNEAGEKNVNAPGEVREFIFSPEVGRTIHYPHKPGEMEKIKRFGRGELRILDYKLGDLVPGEKARFEWMRFEVDLSWPAEEKGDKSSSGAIRMAFDPGVERLNALREKRDLVGNYLSSVEKELLVFLKENGLKRVLFPRNWRDDLLKQSERADFRGYGVELWGSDISEKKTPYLNIRCNVLCLNQISLAAEPPTCSISKPEHDIRFDWHVKTGIRSVDQTIRNRLPIWSGINR